MRILLLLFILNTTQSISQLEKRIFVSPNIQFNHLDWGQSRIIPFIGFKSGFEFSFNANNKFQLPIYAKISNHSNKLNKDKRQTNVIVGINPEYTYKPYFLSNTFLMLGINYQVLISYNYYYPNSNTFEKLIEDYLYITVGAGWYWINKKSKPRGFDLKLGFSDGFAEYQTYVSASYSFYTK